MISDTSYKGRDRFEIVLELMDQSIGTAYKLGCEDFWFITKSKGMLKRCKALGVKVSEDPYYLICSSNSKKKYKNMSDKNNNAGPSPFHKKGTDEGDNKKNWVGRKFSSVGSILDPTNLGQSSGGLFSQTKGSDKVGKDDWGIDAARGRVDKTFGEFGAIDTSANLFAGAENKMNIRDNYSNTMEDLTVNQQQFQLQKEMSQQGAANAMDTFRGAAGGSGTAGLAQAMAN